MAVLVIASSACTSTPKPPPRPDRPSFERGGTLRIVEPAADEFTLPFIGSALNEDFDPHRAFWGNAWELFRCCLLRTLVSYDVDPANGDEVLLRPDLAADEPDISADGLTWTFHIRSGLHYGPPLQKTPIVAADFVRALQRAGAERVHPPGVTDGGSDYLSIIRGFDEYQEGLADSISGLETPDDLTLVIHLTRPAGDLPSVLALPATAPIPPEPLDPGASLGVATGHHLYGSFLVSSGPYMLEGSEDLDFSVPPDEQEPVEGFDPGKSITLVRNPMWEPASDPLRLALVDRIEVSIGGTREGAFRSIETGKADGTFETLAGAQIRELRSSGLQDQVHFDAGMSTVFIAMNLAVPPFDDIHVRKAINYVIDKARVMSLAERFTTTFLDPTNAVATHFVPDVLENELLDGYDPYGTDGARGDVDLAREQMSRSPYDTDGDGMCDDPVCAHIVAPTIEEFVGDRGSAVVVRNLRELGLDVRREVTSLGEVQPLLTDPTEQIPLFIARGWIMDFPNASTFFVPLFTGAGITPNTSLIGATSQQLVDWGYSVTEVPSLDDRIAECQALVKSEQIECWARLDKYVMDEIVPAVPLIWGRRAMIVSERVEGYSYDRLTLTPALDQIALQQPST